MAHEDDYEQRRAEVRMESRQSWLPLFLVGIALALAAASIAISRDPLSTAEWIGFFVVMMLAFGLELAAFERVD